MLLALAGRRHDVTTAYRIRFGGRTLDRAVTTTVSFRSLQPGRARRLHRVRRVAGQGRRLRGPGHARRVFATELRGSHTNVIGLPLAELLADLQALEALPALPARRLRRAVATT